MRGKRCKGFRKVARYMTKALGHSEETLYSVIKHPEKAAPLLTGGSIRYSPRQIVLSDCQRRNYLDIKREWSNS